MVVRAGCAVRIYAVGDKVEVPRLELHQAGGTEAAVKGSGALA